MRLSGRSILLFLAVFVAGQILQSRYQRRHSLRSQKREALQTWEGEGGAVPLDSHRTAATVSAAQKQGRR